MKQLVHLIFMIAMVAALIPETARSQDWARFDRAVAYAWPNNERVPMGIGAIVVHVSDATS